MFNAEEPCRLVEGIRVSADGYHQHVSVITVAEKVFFIDSLRETPAHLETNDVLFSETLLRWITRN